MELPESSSYSDTHPSSASYQPNVGIVSRSSSNNVNAPLAMSITSADDIDSLSFPNHPSYSDLFLASSQHDPGTTPTWLTPGMEIPAMMPGNNFNHNNSLSLVDPGSASELAPALIQPNAMLSEAYVSNGSRSSRNTVHPNAQDWKRHQALIAKLYAEHTLPEVMKFMAGEHGFRATYALHLMSDLLFLKSLTSYSIKMYKTRIKQWGLDTKNNREREMRAIARIHKQRLDQGKRSTYRVAGRLMEYEDAVRYFRRKNIRIEDVIARRTSSPIPEAVQCFTPALSPTNAPAAMSFTPIHRPIVTPRVLALPERLLVTIRSYLCSSFESGTWKPTGGSSSSCRSKKITRAREYNLYNLLYQCSRACMLFTNGYPVDAGKALDLAAGSIGRILSADHPQILCYLFIIVRMVHCRRRIEIALSLLRQFSAMAEILLGRGHPLCQIVGWLTCVDLPQLNDTIGRCGESLADCFETFAGPMDPSTADTRIMGIERIWLRGEHLRRLLKRCESDQGWLNSRWLSISARLLLSVQPPSVRSCCGIYFLLAVGTAKQ
jgi:hypothetical protein